MNPGIDVVPHDTMLTSDNAFEIIGQYDIVIDGSDNFPVRYLVNDATQMLGKPLVYGSIYQFEGQASVFMPGQDTPCYRCLFPQPPPPGSVPSCAEAGVFGVLPGIIGSIQAVEAIKLIIGKGDPLVGPSAAVRRAGHGVHDGEAALGPRLPRVRQGTDGDRADRLRAVLRPAVPRGRGHDPGGGVRSRCR